MADTDLAVDRLGSEDVGAAHDLSTRAGWSTARSDWRRMVALDAVDAFAGRIDDGDRPVATATLVRYGSRVGWIGMMLVHPDHRRRGYGARMLEACLDAAEDAGVGTVGLDANTDGKPLYDANGFVEVAEVTQWHGSLDGPDRTDGVPTVAEVADADPFAALDRRASGVDRRFLLESLLEEAGTVGLLRREGGGVTGYALVLRRPPGATVGPLVAEDPETAEALLRAAGERIDGPLTVNAVGNPRAEARYRELGFEHRRSLARMTYRERAEPLMGELVWGIPAFEYG
jgi:GNAT superfamily N-acetyltransferase